MTVMPSRGVGCKFFLVGGVVLLLADCLAVIEKSSQRCPVVMFSKRAQNKTGRAPKAIDQLYLVAGAGFEPTTFGL